VTLAAALVTAAVLTYLRTPTLSATGSAIDRRLHLQDRIAAALQVGREQDPVSALVVRDAATRLRGATPADVFPLDLGRRAVAATLLLTMALLTVTADLRRAASSRQPGAGAGAVAMARPEGAIAAPESPIDAAAAASGSDVQPSETANARPSGTQAANPSPQSAAEAAADRAGSRPDEAQASSLAPAPTAPNEAESRSRIVRTAAQSAAELQSEKGGAGTGPGGQSAAGAQSRAPLGAMPAGAGGSTPDAGRPKGGQSGGVAAGGLSSNIPPARSGSSRAVDGSLLAVGAARAEADAAVSRDDIPPALRQYVRDYFLRLQATSGPR
jgi:hypothetical protein